MICVIVIVVVQRHMEASFTIKKVKSIYNVQYTIISTQFANLTCSVVGLVLGNLGLFKDETTCLVGDTLFSRLCS